jgi:hypothetical protein
MDFGLDWTLDDARYVAGDAWKAAAKDPGNKKFKRKLNEVGCMYTQSLFVLNQECGAELANYRRSLVEHMPKAAQDEALDALYSAHTVNMEKAPFRALFRCFGIG